MSINFYQLPKNAIYLGNFCLCRIYYDTDYVILHVKKFLE